MSKKTNAGSGHAMENRKNRAALIPMFLVGFIPLLMYYHIYDSKLGDYPWFGISQKVDVFLYVKMEAIILVGVVMLCILAYAFLQNNHMASFIRKNGKPLIPLFVYLLLSVLSTVFSKYSYWGYHGIADQFESMWVLLGYGMFALYAFLFIKEERDIKACFFFIMTGAGLVTLIGAFQAFSLDFYRSKIGRMTYIPLSMQNNEVTFTFEMGRTYTSLYNPNYVGMFVCLLAPAALILCLFIKNKILKVVYGLIFLTMLFSLFGSKSKSGILVLSVSLLLLILLLRKKCLRYWKQSLLLIIIVIGVFAAFNTWRGSDWMATIKASLFPGEAPEPPLSSIETNDKDIRIHYLGNELIFEYHPEGQSLTEQLKLMDESGNLVASVADENGNIIIQDERFAGIQAAYANISQIVCFQLNINGIIYYFTNQAGDDTYYYITLTGKLDKINNAKTAPFMIGKENIASRRGFIWSKTIPLLKDYLFLGSGADSFTIVYPNDDYVGKNNWGYGNQLISKPHSMYLQIGVQTGVLSLLALLIFYGWYFISSILLYKSSSFETFAEQIGAAILIGTFSYMIMGITNDSSVGVAPLFWLLMGTGLAINIQVKSRSSK